MYHPLPNCVTTCSIQAVDPFWRYFASKIWSYLLSGMRELIMQIDTLTTPLFGWKFTSRHNCWFSIIVIFWLYYVNICWRLILLQIAGVLLWPSPYPLWRPLLIDPFVGWSLWRSSTVIQLEFTSMSIPQVVYCFGTNHLSNVRDCRRWGKTSFTEMFVCLIFIRFISHHLLLLTTVPFFLMTNIVYYEKAMLNHSFFKKSSFCWGVSHISS